MKLVLLHGWGCDGRIWQPLIEALRAGDATDVAVTLLELPGFGGNSGCPWPDDETLLQQLYAQLPADCLLVGHSLGGMLAARMAAQRGQTKIAGLITIAANATFLQRADWPGMDPETFARFRHSLADTPKSTWEKFCGLQARGDAAMRRVLKQLKDWPPPSVDGAWLSALECLGRLDNRGILREIPLPALHLFGGKDALVPAAAADKIRQLGATAEVLVDCGHAPQISRPELVAEKIRAFLPQRGDGPISCGEPPLDKSAVARSFGRAAATYDAAAHLQRAVCRQLLADTDSGWAPEVILDLGSGTGYGSEMLRQRFPRARIVALDLAEAMLRYARERRPAADNHIVADAEQLPLADGSVDLIFSSMALQWCYRLPGLFAELRRVLAEGGHCLVATLGPATLHELKSSWAAVDSGVHVNRFLPRDAWLAAAAESGFSGALRAESRVLHYRTVQKLMRDLKNIGARNINRDADRGLTGREKLRRLTAAYEPLRTEAGLPASYEVLYLELAAGRCGRGHVRLVDGGTFAEKRDQG
ncbi:malonyl-CoA O-methyltransferase [Microbulbifer thermotolerans]|uniref:malonyl-ACP O-methyltransferase BioC n=1 Tax=Microbulbifer thermotolerans TaxID=252514 RepID=UPI0008E74B3E|nr:malonyl-ACP O-methyltransferase BioC [Microbulbifer thermotolerans]SFC39180.1 malonyl-CoA O-methyltransferase [Microbulbifer thermotolerans]